MGYRPLTRQNNICSKHISVKGVNGYSRYSYTVKEGGLDRVQVQIHP